MFLRNSMGNSYASTQVVICFWKSVNIAINCYCDYSYYVCICMKLCVCVYARASLMRMREFVCVCIRNGARYNTTMLVWAIPGSHEARRSIICVRCSYFSCLLNSLHGIIGVCGVSDTGVSRYWSHNRQLPLVHILT